MPTHSKAARLAEFLERLKAAHPAPDADGAYVLIEDTIGAVEDELTDIPANPELWQSDGRMYPPQADARRTVEGFAGVCRYRSVAHHTLIGENGAIEIRAGSAWKQAEVVFSKAGADGQDVWSGQVPPSDE